MAQGVQSCLQWNCWQVLGASGLTPRSAVAPWLSFSGLRAPTTVSVTACPRHVTVVGSNDFCQEWALSKGTLSALSWAVLWRQVLRHTKQIQNCSVRRVSSQRPRCLVTKLVPQKPRTLTVYVLMLTALFSGGRKLWFPIAELLCASRRGRPVIASAGHAQLPVLTLGCACAPVPSLISALRADNVVVCTSRGNML